VNQGFDPQNFNQGYNQGGYIDNQQGYNQQGYGQGFGGQSQNQRWGGQGGYRGGWGR
jgi:hypothetical protein